MYTCLISWLFLVRVLLRAVATELLPGSDRHWCVNYLQKTNTPVRPFVIIHWLAQF